MQNVDHNLGFWEKRLFFRRKMWSWHRPQKRIALKYFRRKKLEQKNYLSTQIITFWCQVMSREVLERKKVASTECKLQRPGPMVRGPLSGLTFPPHISKDGRWRSIKVEEEEDPDISPLGFGCELSVSWWSRCRRWGAEFPRSHLNVEKNGWNQFC
jgi:hypothetical protein